MRGSGPESPAKKRRPRGKNEPAFMGTGCINVGHKNRKTENWATEHPIDRHVPQSSKRTMLTNTHKPERNQVDTHSIRKTNVANSADISRKWLRQCI
jgi:hypothetical protein